MVDQEEDIVEMGVEDTEVDHLLEDLDIVVVLVDHLLVEDMLLVVMTMEVVEDIAEDHLQEDLDTVDHKVVEMVDMHSEVVMIMQVDTVSLVQLNIVEMHLIMRILNEVNNYKNGSYEPFL